MASDWFSIDNRPAYLEPREDCWLRNSPRYGAFHLKAPGWIQSGKAVCGQDLSRPSVSVTNPMPGLQKLCKVCLAMRAGHWAKRSSVGNP